MTAHWGVPDPAAVEGTDEVKRKAFRDALFALRRRIELFASLPFDKLSRLRPAGARAPDRPRVADGSCDLLRRATAEGLGTAGLLAAVVGSGIMGERLAGGNVAIALLANSLATGGALLR